MKSLNKCNGQIVTFIVNDQRLDSFE